MTDQQKPASSQLLTTSRLAMSLAAIFTVAIAVWVWGFRGSDAPPNAAGSAAPNLEVIGPLWPQTPEGLGRMFDTVEAARLQVDAETFDPEAVVRRAGRAPEVLFAWVR